MRTSVLLALVTALLVPAPPVTAQPRPGRLVVTVTGLPKGERAVVILDGPGPTLRKRVRHRLAVRGLRPGKYTIRSKQVRAGGAVWRAAPDRTRVRPSRPQRVRLQFRPAAKARGDVPVASSPFPSGSAAQSLALVSRTPSGSAGDDMSRYPTWQTPGTVVFSSCAPGLTGVVDGCHGYQADLGSGAVTRLAGVELGDDLDTSGGRTAVSPDGRSLLFLSPVRLVAGDTDAYADVHVLTDGRLARVSQSAPGSGIGGDVPEVTDPVWAPDSSRVAFVTAGEVLTGDGDDLEDVFIGDAGGTSVRITADAISGHPTWSPDGSRVAFAAEDPDSGDSDVLIAPASGGSPQRLTRDGRSDAPAWAPSGDRIAFVTDSALVADDTNGVADVYVQTVSSGRVSRLSVDGAGQQSGWASEEPVWSPDGRRIAFVASAEGRGAVVVVKDLATGALTQVTPPDPTSAMADLVFAPDGTRLAFSSDHPALIAGDDNADWDVFVAAL